MDALENKVLQALESSEIMNQLLKDYEPFIRMCAAAAAGKYLDSSMEEWSIGLSAFHEAILAYNPEKGNFLSFARLVIHRRMLDFRRKESRRNQEISVEPRVFEGRLRDGDGEVERAVSRSMGKGPEVAIQEEIEAFRLEIQRFGFDYFDLQKASPKSKKTRAQCRRIIRYLMFKDYTPGSTGRLPLKRLSEDLKISLPFLEIHRRFILAGFLIIQGEYRQLQSYLMGDEIKPEIQGGK